jgi:hypothetical protein
MPIPRTEATGNTCISLVSFGLYLSSIVTVSVADYTLAFAASTVRQAGMGLA